MSDIGDDARAMRDTFQDLYNDLFAINSAQLLGLNNTLNNTIFALMTIPVLPANAVLDDQVRGMNKALNDLRGALAGYSLNAAIAKIDVLREQIIAFLETYHDEADAGLIDPV